MDWRSCDGTDWIISEEDLADLTDLAELSPSEQDMSEEGSGLLSPSEQDLSEEASGLADPSEQDMSEEGSGLADLTELSPSEQDMSEEGLAAAGVSSQPCPEPDSQLPQPKHPENPASTTRRRSYTREKKLVALKYFFEHGCNKTCKKFTISMPSLNRWIKNEESIRSGKKGSKRVGGGRPPFWPDVEAKLVEEFEAMRQKGLKVKQYWFKARSFQLMKQMHPDVNFCFSQGWFDMFKSRNKISHRRATNIAHKTPADHKELIRNFHQSIRRIHCKNKRVI